MNKTVATIGLLLFLLFYSNVEGQEMADISRKFCEQIFGALPDSDSMKIAFSANHAGQLAFVFSLPSQKLISSGRSSAPVSFVPTDGVPYVEVIVLPRYSKNDLERLRDLNDAIRQSLPADEKPSANFFDIPVFQTGDYGFHFIEPEHIPESKKSQTLFAEQMNLLFANTKHLSPRQFATTKQEYFRSMFTFEADMNKNKVSSTVSESDTVKTESKSSD